MNNKNTCFEQNKENFKRYPGNRDHSANGKVIAIQHSENNKERLQEQARNP